MSTAITIVNNEFNTFESAIIYQFVEVIIESKLHSLLALIHHLVTRRDRFPMIKMVVYAWSSEIPMLEFEILQRFHQQIAVHSLPLAIPTKSGRRVYVKTMFKDGILLVGRDFLDVPRADVPNVNFVVNYSFPPPQVATNFNFGTWYNHRLQQIDRSLTEAFVFNIITIDDYLHLDKLIKILLGLSQVINPLLLHINADIGRGVPRQQILHSIACFLNTNPQIGDLKSFFNMTTIEPLVTELPPFIDPEPQIPFSHPLTEHFVEVLTHEQKFTALKTILDELLARPKYARFRMLLVSSDPTVSLLADLLLKHFPTLPVVQFPPLSDRADGGVSTQVLNEFQYGVFLFGSPTQQEILRKDLIDIDIVLIYEYNTTLTIPELMEMFSSKSEERYVVTFVPPFPKPFPLAVLSYLQEYRRPVNPFLATICDLFETMKYKDLVPYLFEKTKNERDRVTDANLSAFLNKITVENVSQFVEILSEEEKTTTLLKIVLRWFCESLDYSQSRILVFVKDENLPFVEQFLQNGLARLAPQISIIRDAHTRWDRRKIISEFFSGVLLVSEHSFQETNQKTGIESVNFVVNYDFSATREASAHHDYHHRIANVNALIKGSVITFVTKQTLPFVKQLVKILQDSKQEVNPDLLKLSLETGSAQKSSLMKAIANRNLVEAGNMKAFFKFLQTPQPVTSISSNVTSVLPAVPTPVSTADTPNCLQFVEILPPDQKSITLLNVLKHIITLYSANSLKVLVFVRGLTDDKVKTIDSLISDGLAGVGSKFWNLARLYAHCKDAYGEIQKRVKLFTDFENAILFSDVDSRFLGVEKTDFVIFYEAPSTVEIYTDAIARFRTGNGCTTYLLTFLLKTNDEIAKRLINILSAYDQEINPELSNLANKKIVDCAEGPSSEKGNVLALYAALHPKSKLDRNQDSQQFVEVVASDQKSVVFLNFIQQILAIWQYERLKILVFIRGLGVGKIQQLINSMIGCISGAQSKFPGFCRLFVSCKIDQATIQSRFKKFNELTSALMITDVDSRYLGIEVADFIVFHDTACSPTIYLDALNRFYSTISSQTYFVTFYVATESDEASDLTEILGKLNHEVLTQNSQELAPLAAEKRNIAALFQHILNTPPPAHFPSSDTQTSTTSCSKPVTNDCLQYVEVLTIDEKADALHDLFQYILSLYSYRHLKVAIFVRGFTRDRQEQFNKLLEKDMRAVQKRYPDFRRFFAYCKCDTDEIGKNLKAFQRASNAVLITDVDSRYLGVKSADFVIFYDSPNTSHIYLDALARFSSKNANHTVFITFLMASDCGLTTALVNIFNEHSLPINPLIYKVLDRVKHPITDSAIREQRRSTKVGNLAALYDSHLDANCVAPITNFSQLKRKLPACLLDWLESTGYNKLGLVQSHVWPVMFAKMDLLAIAPNSEERILTYVLAAITWILQEEDVPENGLTRPVVVIFTPTQESAAQIQALLQLFYHLLTGNGHTNLNQLLISVEQPVNFCQSMRVEQEHIFSRCKYVIFDEFDKMMQLEQIEEVANILLIIRDEKMCDGDVCLNVFSAEFSVFENLVSLEFLENYHYFNMAELTKTVEVKSKWITEFSSICHYVEVTGVGKTRFDSLCELLTRILDKDTDKFSIVVLLAGDNDELFAVYNELLIELSDIASQIFYKKQFADDAEQRLFWQHFMANANPIFLTNESHQIKKVNAKYVINFYYPTGPLSAFEYLKRMICIRCKNASIITYFGYQDFKYSDILVELLMHMKQPINPLLEELKQSIQEDESVTEMEFEKLLRRGRWDAMGDLWSFKQKLGRKHWLNSDECASTSSRGMEMKRKKISISSNEDSDVMNLCTTDEDE